MVQLTEYQKYKIIFLYENNSIQSIAKQLKINRNTVSKWINRYLNSDMERQIGSGRPSKCSNDVIIAIQQEIIDNKYITLKEIKINLNKDNIDISESTIKTILNNHGYNYIHPPKKFPLTEEHKLKRLKFAIKYLDFDWTEVIFSDEVAFWMSKNPLKRWCNIHIQKDHDVVFKHSAKVNAWGAICITESFDLNVFTINMNAD